MKCEPDSDLMLGIPDVKAINNVAAKMYAIASNSGFHDKEKAEASLSLGSDKPGMTIGRIAEFVANLHGEASELWEAARKNKLHEPCDKPVQLSCAAEELADIVIRCMDTAVALGVDLGAAIAIKARFNQTRPRMHGKVA